MHLEIISKVVTSIKKEMIPLCRVYEMDCTIPLESELKVQIFDFDYLSGDDLIGETKIDLENRYLSTHRGFCGLPKRYYTYVFTSKKNKFYSIPLTFVFHTNFL